MASCTRVLCIRLRALPRCSWRSAPGHPECEAGTPGLSGSDAYRLAQYHLAHGRRGGILGHDIDPLAAPGASSISCLRPKRSKRFVRARSPRADRGRSPPWRCRALPTRIPVSTVARRRLPRTLEREGPSGRAVAPVFTAPPRRPSTAVPLWYISPQTASSLLLLLPSEGFDRFEAGGAVGREDAEDHPDQCRHPEGEGHLSWRHHRRGEIGEYPRQQHRAHDAESHA